MAKRVLVKVATELNVGKDSIVEHLLDKGFEIDNKPNAKISDEMYDELLREFQKDMAIKDKADQMVIGNRPAAKDKSEKEPAKTSPFSLPREEAPKTKPVSLRPTEEKAEEAPKEETPKEEKPKEKEPEMVERPGKAGLKVVGKIDLEPKTKKAAEEKKKKEAPKEEPTEEPPAEGVSPDAGEADGKGEQPKEKEAPAKPEEKEAGETIKEEGTAAKDDYIKAEAPELRGLKILGKIDADKLKKKKKEKKEKAKPGQQTDSAAKEGGDEDSGRKRRRRKRRKVTSTTSDSRGRGASRRSGKKEEVQEISQKEIEEKIKATMARLQGGGGKKKRQRMRRDNRERIREKQEMLEMDQENEKLQITEFVSVNELANLMDVSVADVITTCMNLGVVVSINQRLDAEVIELVASEFGHEVEFISAEEQIGVEDEEELDDPEDLAPRNPIVTVMGHVDHGKTSLLDYIRRTKVVEGEAGGITQHIGAYEVTLEDGRQLTFLDTPGHEAFTAMRARGAKVTDIAVIIVAADDSIMPQTREAISHAEAAGVPIVFAINKIDKDGANPEKIKQDLASMNYLVESWGGKYQSQDISAKTGTGIDELLEKILLEAEMLELKANPDRKAVGTILEASLEKGRGYVAKALIQMGTLSIGDPMVSGEYSGKVKAMFNERNQRVDSAGPSSPVLILGLDGAPQAGESLKETDSEQEARQIAAKRSQINREQATRASKRISLDEIGRRLALGTFKELNLIVKGDVDGSVEALSDSLLKLSQETVQVNVIHKAVGGIVESDVLLASASDAIIIGFQVRPSLAARKLAEQEGVQIKTYSIIYEAIEEIKMAIEGMLEPTKEEKIHAEVEVREVYKISKVGTVAGCYVLDGKITKNSLVRIIREGIVVYPTKEGSVGELSSLKRYKDDVKEVRAGMECGITIKNFNDLKVGDIIEGYEIIEVKQTLA